MLTKIEIENFKSIHKETIELGRVNVFIGENGCGKTNILEAVGMASAAMFTNLSNDELAIKGIRVAKPSITFSSFNGQKQISKIELKCKFDYENYKLPLSLWADNETEIFSKWKVDKSKFDEDLIKFNLGTLEITKDSYINVYNHINRYVIYNLTTQVLRGIGQESRGIPGLHGENMDLLIESLSKNEFEELFNRASFVSWLDEIEIDREGNLRLEGHNLDLSNSKLYFRDKFMAKKNNIFSAENANEGILHILFYLALFISKNTPKFFAIDNIETALNPYLCTALMEELVKLAKKNDKQVLITTHNPAILDGLNLHDDEVRLFVVERDFKGHTRVERKKLKPDVELNGRRLKLSELWMRGYLGAIPQHF